MRHAGQTVTRQDFMRGSWGLQPESDSNLVDVYVNYLRKKSRLRRREKLIHTVRRAGYRIGKPAPQGAASSSNMQSNSGHADFDQYYQSSRLPVYRPARSATNAADGPDSRDGARFGAAANQHPVLSGSHGMHKGDGSPLPAEIKSIEQQADRAMLWQGNIGLVREGPRAQRGRGLLSIPSSTTSLMILTCCCNPGC